MIYNIDHLRVRCGVMDEPQQDTQNSNKQIILTVNTREVNIFNIIEEDIKYLHCTLKETNHQEKNSEITKNINTDKNSKYTNTFKINIPVRVILKKISIKEHIEPYKLNLYTEGSCIYQDPARPGLMGTLVLILPTPHTGGEFVFSSFNVENTLPKDKLRFIYFDSELKHDVGKVLSGNRITLVYNIFDTEASTMVYPNIEVNSIQQELYDTVLREAVEFCKDKKNILLGACKFRNDIYLRLKKDLEKRFSIIEVAIDKHTEEKDISNIEYVFEVDEDEADGCGCELEFDDLTTESHNVEHVLFSSHSKLDEQYKLLKTRRYRCDGCSPSQNSSDYNIEYIKCYLINPSKATKAAKRPRYL